MIGFDKRAFDEYSKYGCAWRLVSFDAGNGTVRRASRSAEQRGGKCVDERGQKTRYKGRV